MQNLTTITFANLSAFGRNETETQKHKSGNEVSYK